MGFSRVGGKDGDVGLRSGGLPAPAAVDCRCSQPIGLNAPTRRCPKLDCSGLLMSEPVLIDSVQKVPVFSWKACVALSVPPPTVSTWPQNLHSSVEPEILLIRWNEQDGQPLIKMASAPS